MSFLKSVGDNSTLILSLITLALVIVTFFYLLETKNIRRIAERTFLLENVPRVCLAKVESKPMFNRNNKEIGVDAVFTVKNIGRSAAKDFCVNYRLSTGKIQITDSTDMLPFIVPDQIVFLRTNILRWKLSEHEFDVVERAAQTNKAITIGENIIPEVSLDMSLQYLDHEGKEQCEKYKYKYIMHLDKWVYISPQAR